MDYQELSIGSVIYEVHRIYNGMPLRRGAAYWSECCSSSQILPLTKGTLVRYNTLSGSVRRKEAKVRTDKLTLGFAYLRLSNEEAQGGESSSITNQRMIVQNYCKQNGITLVREFADDGYSGGNFDRPAFQEMMKQLQQGKANTVITKDLSRLGPRYAGGQLLR